MEGYLTHLTPSETIKTQQKPQHCPKYCSYFQLNVAKTKDLVIDSPSTHKPICINNKTFEMVECFWTINSANKDCLHFLLLLYKSIIQPILLYCSPCFYTVLTASDRNKLTRITNNATMPPNSLVSLHPSFPTSTCKAIKHRASTVTLAPRHIIHPILRTASI